jgi:hypothetical protein
MLTDSASPNLKQLVVYVEYQQPNVPLISTVRIFVGNLIKKIVWLIKTQLLQTTKGHVLSTYNHKGNNQMATNLKTSWVFQWTEYYSTHNHINQQRSHYFKRHQTQCITVVMRALGRVYADEPPRGTRAHCMWPWWPRDPCGSEPIPSAVLQRNWFMYASSFVSLTIAHRRSPTAANASLPKITIYYPWVFRPVWLA